MIKPVELLVISAVSFGAATLHNTPSVAVGVRPVGVAPVVGGAFAALVKAQTSLAAASQRARTTSECGLQGARDRARAVSCN
jgi:hypothetical protein